MDLKKYEYYRTDLGVLYHADCLSIMPHLEPVDLVLTDPPYGMKWDGKITRGKNGTGKAGATRHYGCKIVGDNKCFDPNHLLKFKEVIIFGFQHFSNNLPTGTILVWLKRYDSGFGSYLSDADLAWMNRGHGVYCFRDLSLQGDSSNKTHPTQKPVPLIIWCLSFSNTFGIAMDPYLGSGTTAVACEQLNRRWIGIEISEKYCEIAAKRIERERQQLKLFGPEDIQPKPEQQNMF